MLIRRSACSCMAAHTSGGLHSQTLACAHSANLVLAQGSLMYLQQLFLLPTLLQMTELKFDDVGKRQVAVEEMFVLQKGIIHPFNP